MKIKQATYNLVLSAFFISFGLGICRAEPNVELKWAVDLKSMLVKYSVINTDATTIRWSNHVLTLCREDTGKSIVPTLASDPVYASDDVIHPYIEIVTRPLKGSRVESFGGFMPPPIEIKPGETRDFSYSLADERIFDEDPTDVKQIESASFQLVLNGKIVKKYELKYEAGKWKKIAP